LANKKFVAEFSAEERAAERSDLQRQGSAKVILKARILLKADKAEGGAGWSDDDVCRALDTNVTMVQRVREKLVTEGLDAVLTRKKRETPPITPIFDGAAQAQLTALACSEPPPGHALLDDPSFGGKSCGTQNRQGGALQHGRAGVKKNDLKPHLTQYWVIPPKANAAFVAAMEDVLVYTRPHDTARPLVSLDETAKQLIAETRTPEPMRPAEPARHDCGQSVHAVRTIGRMAARHGYRKAHGRRLCAYPARIPIASPFPTGA
jgi:Homeodomain-like domain